MIPDNPLTEHRRHPNHWTNRANDLHASAGALWYAMEHDSPDGVGAALGFHPTFSMGVACMPVYYMLCGLSLEVAMKAVLACRDMEPPKTHNLGTLAGMIHLTVDAGERRLLHFYTDAIAWAGRYPTPLDCSDDKLRLFADRASTALTERVKEVKGLELRRGNGAGAWARFDGVWQRIMPLPPQDPLLLP